ncbi:PEP-CTERM protein-sorting domain-containing protein [Terrimicrobium sacchariphilum]|uniref:PEP-CTERM protein-sorting domain-containing protein n=1 Tax=Terrimicrobium sacchariphilum TaxID=690879 RepID=A0A146G2I0_TERSA|nr:autotransporter-associated beta strand repeat-containing protein [Terrimicrobium sacchariphilum]GAT31860.1 PEP-CTERM protein-sorting domain-containing protein [Terrimicrobium sacchariphilum]
MKNLLQSLIHSAPKQRIAMAMALSIAPLAAQAQNVWNGAGVTGGTSGTDWTDSANYTATPTWSSATDLKFSTITNTGAGLTFSAGTAGTYAVKSLYFGDTTASGTGLTTAEILTLNGNAGGATLGLTSNIYMPSTNASKITLGSDLTLNLSNAAHQILSTVNSNVTAQWTTSPVLVVNSLVTGGGASASFTARYTQYGTSPTTTAGTVAMVLTNDNNSYVANLVGAGQRYDGYIGYTSIKNVGEGNSSLGNATTTTTGTLAFGNGGFLNFIGTGNQTTDRNINIASGVNIGNSSTGTTLTLNGAITNVSTGSATTLRASVISGATQIINSNIADGPSVVSVSKFSATNYYNTSGNVVSNDGGGLLVLNGNNSYTGTVTVNAGTLRIGHANALGSTAGGTTVSNGAVLDLNGQTVGAEALSITGTGISSSGALINSSGTAASYGGAVTLAGNTSLGGSGSTTFSGNFGETGGVRTFTKVGAGTVTLGGANTYTGTTTVSAGTLLINGSNASTATVTVASGAAIGGTGTIASSLSISAGGKFVFNLTDALTVNGAAVTFGSGFGIASLIGLDSSTANGTYSLIDGLATVNLTNVSNIGEANAYDLGSGKSAYFLSSGLQVVVVPEPSTLALFAGATGVVLLLRRRRA